MKKIKSLFKRNYEGNRQVYDCVVEGAEWVVNGEGIATRKWDGMAVMVKDGVVYARYDAKAGRTPPEGFMPAQPEPDAETGHWPGWVITSDLRIMDGIQWGIANLFDGGPVTDGTYEVCGPKIGTRHGANPEGLATHILVPHGAEQLPDFPRTFAEIRDYFTANPMIEGVVWHHPDGDMVKIKISDFGIKRRNEA